MSASNSWPDWPDISNPCASSFAITAGSVCAAQANDGGITNAEVCHSLGLHSNYAGGSKDYLSWSILGLLMKEGRLKRETAEAAAGITRHKYDSAKKTFSAS
jgi:hypothetical protein